MFGGRLRIVQMKSYRWEKVGNCHNLPEAGEEIAASSPLRNFQNNCSKPSIV